jgi:hypothetical protein
MRFQLKGIAAIVFTFGAALGAVAQDAPFRRAAPATMAKLKALKTAGVSVAEVSDYVYGNYQGDFNRCADSRASGSPKARAARPTPHTRPRCGWAARNLEGLRSVGAKCL